MKDHEIVSKMYSQDAFSQWLGIEIILKKAGKSIVKMTVRPEMTNGFGIAHGGITYSLADSALAFASNSHGRQSLSIETAISHLKPVKTGDLITAQAQELSLSDKFGIYQINVTNQEDQLVATFKGTVYRTPKNWE